MNGVRVKALVWEDDSDHWHPGTRWRAMDCFGGHYEIELCEGEYAVDHGALISSAECADLDAAKAAAQADYEARILSAIDTTAIDAELAALRSQVSALTEERDRLRGASQRLLREAELDGMESRSGWDCWMTNMRAAHSPKPEGE